MAMRFVAFRVGAVESARGHSDSERADRSTLHPNGASEPASIALTDSEVTSR